MHSLVLINLTITFNFDSLSGDRPIHVSIVSSTNYDVSYDIDSLDPREAPSTEGCPIYTN